jgi:hypothetical protein
MRSSPAGGSGLHCAGGGRREAASARIRREATPITEGKRGGGAVRRTGRIEYEWAWAMAACEGCFGRAVEQQRAELRKFEVSHRIAKTISKKMLYRKID